MRRTSLAMMSAAGLSVVPAPARLLMAGPKMAEASNGDRVQSIPGRAWGAVLRLSGPFILARQELAPSRGGAGRVGPVPIRQEHQEHDLARSGCAARIGQGISSAIGRCARRSGIAGACLLAAALMLHAPGEAQAEAKGQDLAKKLANPISSLISVPLQANYDTQIGPEDDGQRFVFNVQPVIPIALSDQWNLISRTIVPITWQDDIFPGAGSQFGLGDVVQSAFLSPQEPGWGGITWGVGPVVLVPTATDRLLGAGKLGLGPTAVVLTQQGPWTVGALGNHIWSVAGNGSRADVNRTFLQPFLAYTTQSAWTFTLNTESTYDWEAEAWSVPVNAQVSKVVNFGSQPVSIGAGVRYWAASPSSGPEGVGGRVTVSFLFPR